LSEDGKFVEKRQPFQQKRESASAPGSVTRKIAKDSESKNREDREKRAAAMLKKGEGLWGGVMARAKRDREIPRAARESIESEGSGQIREQHGETEHRVNMRDQKERAFERQLRGASWERRSYARRLAMMDEWRLGGKGLSSSQQGRKIKKGKIRKGTKRGKKQELTLEEDNNVKSAHRRNSEEHAM